MTSIELLCQPAKGHGFGPADIEHLAHGVIRECGRAERVDGIIDVHQVANLVAPPDFESCAFDDGAKPHPDERLAPVANAHSRAECVRQPKHGRSRPVHLMVQDVEQLAGQLVHAVDVGRARRVIFSRGKALGAPVDLARARVDDADRWVDLAADIENGELRARIDVEVLDGLAHRVHVRDQRGEVHDHILVAHEPHDRIPVANVPDVDRRAFLEGGGVVAIGAGIRR